MGFEWSDKRDKTGFGSVTRGGEKFFHVVILLRLKVWALGGWVTGLFSLCDKFLPSRFPLVIVTRPIVSMAPMSTEYHGYSSSSEMKQLPSSGSGTKSGSVITSGSPPPPLELESPSPSSVISSSSTSTMKPRPWHHLCVIQCPISLLSKLWNAIDFLKFRSKQWQIIFTNKLPKAHSSCFGVLRYHGSFLLSGLTFNPSMDK